MCNVSETINGNQVRAIETQRPERGAGEAAQPALYRPPEAKRSREKTIGRAKRNSEQEDSNVGRRIFVGNLNYDTNEQGLRDFFGERWNVVEVRIIVDRDTGRSRGFGFVELENDEAASAAIESLDGSELDGRRVSLREAYDRPRRGGGGGFDGGFRSRGRGGFGRDDFGGGRGGGGYGGPPRGGFDGRSEGRGRGRGRGGFDGRGRGEGRPRFDDRRDRRRGRDDDWW